MPRKHITVVGSVNLDPVGTGMRIPAPGETVAGRDFQVFRGGKGANQRYATALWDFRLDPIPSVVDRTPRIRLANKCRT
jgi:hypothetical protein